MVGFQYTVPLISEDLSEKETYMQLCNALSMLSAISEDIFNRIDTKVEENLTSLMNIDSRIEVAQDKIDSIRGSTKALQVFSAPKYPCSVKKDVYSDYTSIYKDVKEILVHNENDSILQCDAFMDQNSEEVIKKKLRFYSVPSLAADKSHDYEEGLGNMSEELDNVGSLLLFNTSENLYKEYVYLDPLGVVIRTRTSAPSEPLPAAPVTISNRDELLTENRRHDNFLFVPDIGDVPSIEVPDFLPDLLGVAGDLTYENENIWSIAPSVPGNLGDSKSSVGTEAPPPPPPAASSSNNSSSTDGPSKPITPRSTDPPPPPPPATTASVPPPPPPPPPPTTDIYAAAPTPTADPITASTAASTGKKTTKKSSTKCKSLQDGRSDLLSSIRKAGGAKGGKLSTIAKRKKPAAAVTEPSLIDDLSAKLLLRRKGISGGADKKSIGAVTNEEQSMDPMSRISQMIPEPPPPCEVEPRADSPDWE